MSRMRSLAMRSAASLVGIPSALARWKMSRTAPNTPSTLALARSGE